MLVLNAKNPIFLCNKCNRMFYNPKEYHPCDPSEQVRSYPKYKCLCPLCGSKIYSIMAITKPRLTFSLDTDI